MVAPTSRMVGLRRKLTCKPSTARVLVLLVAVAVLAVKLLFAAGTDGTNDALYWTAFADAVRQVGPVGVYTFFPTGGEILYNHPPVIGYWLVLLNAIEQFGPSIRLLVRMTASLADVVTTLVVFEMLRWRRELVEATAGALLVAMSPILLVISGFHANTDPVFVMLVILAGYLLVDRRAPVSAGAALGFAFGVKIVPVVVVPLFLVFAALRGRNVFVRFAGTVGAVVVVTWSTALMSQWDAVMGNVIGYGGVPVRQWGLPEIFSLLSPDWASLVMTGPWRFVALAVAAGVPAWLVWRSPQSLPAALGLALSLLLALSPAFGHQYLVWPAAALFFVSLLGAAFYNLAAGLLLVVVYTRWSGGFPWVTAWASPWRPSEVLLALGVWLLLVVVLVGGIRDELRAPTASRFRPPAPDYLRPSAR